MSKYWEVLSVKVQVSTSAANAQRPSNLTGFHGTSTQVLLRRPDPAPRPATLLAAWRAGTLLATAMPSTTYRHLRLKPSGTMLMCTNAGTDAEERGRLHLDASSSVQIVDEASGGSGGGGSRRPAFRLVVADYKGKTHKEPIEFQCDTSRELQAWVRAIEEVIAALRSADMINRSPRSSQTLVAGMI